MSKFKSHVYISGEDVPEGFFDLPRATQFVYLRDIADYIDNEAKEITKWNPAGESDRQYTFPEGYTVVTNARLGYAALTQKIQ